ncbi:hypothetical protein NM208_g5019 [Fusarium decemcellulare]|uniref:Uncharacterized protein n=1 Tax=Fusarium decemcellulare TaxID=57161 RepID=A0ACC1SIH6_9HYPO|nr:hypothetical protein NM208_g5019 [Fusarium decemcellulare]
MSDIFWKHENVLWPVPLKKREQGPPLRAKPTAYRPNHEPELLPDITALPPQTLPLIASLKGNNIQQQPQSPLFRLPLEIRQNIWELSTATVCDPDRPYNRGWLHWRPNSTGPFRVDTALLKTCRAIYAETWDLPLKQTTLVIHEGTEQDRPLWRPVYPVVLGKGLFYLQAWQILLIRRAHMTFSQFRLREGSIKEWFNRVSDARSKARNVISELAEKPETDYNNGIIQGLLHTQFRTLVVRINRRDWWSWGNPPDDPEQIAYIKAHPDPKRHCLGLDPDTLRNWGGSEDLFSPAFELVLELETFGVKWNQLDHAVEEAKGFVLSKTHSWGEGDKHLAWDGCVKDCSWDLGFVDDCNWFRNKKWKGMGKRVEVREVRYSFRDVGKKAESQNTN